jgi:hypothetical protein
VERLTPKIEATAKAEVVRYRIAPNIADPTETHMYNRKLSMLPHVEKFEEEIMSIEQPPRRGLRFVLSFAMDMIRRTKLAKTASKISMYFGTMYGDGQRDVNDVKFLPTRHENLADQGHALPQVTLMENANFLDSLAGNDDHPPLVHPAQPLEHALL